MKDVPFVAYESALNRAERTNKRLVILTIVFAVAFVLSNVAWLIYESQFTTIETTQEVVQEAENGCNYCAGGDIYG